MKHNRLQVSLIKIIIPFLLLFCGPLSTKAFSILTHEAVIDAAWDSTIKPLLLARYPGTSDSLLNNARAYAYGGAIMPDMGFFPFGSITFTNLIHYVRTGAFFESLLDEAADLNEYAFALGALAHYYSDINGHPIGVNPSVPIVYPKMKKKFGDTVTYAENALSHRRMELAFDVVQLARGGYAPKAYHDFIGFELSTELLERSFFKTYALDMKGMFRNYTLAKGSFRWSVKELFPRLTQAAWRNKKKEIAELNPGINARNFKYRLSRNSYHKEWGTEYEQQGFGARMISFFIRILPKIGPLAPLRFKVPTPEAEKLFINAFNTVVITYGLNVRKIKSGKLLVKNLNLDTGRPIALHEYKLADETYTSLLRELEKNEYLNVSAGLRDDILEFFRNYSNSLPEKTDKEDAQKIEEAISKLRQKSM